MFDFDPTEGAGTEAAVELSGVWESSQVCPACGASEEEAPGTISYSSYNGEYREIWQDARCSRCDAAWSESYYMQGATGDTAGFAVLAGSLLDAAFDVLASGGDGLALRTLGDAVRGIVGAGGAAELERRRAELAGPCLCGMNTSLGCRSQCALSSVVQAPCPGCGGSGEYILSTWAPVYVTVSDGQVTRVRVNDEALDVRGLDGMPSYVTCAGCDARQGDATADAVRAAADASESWPGWEWM